MLIVKNTIESPEEQIDGLKTNVDCVVRYHYDGDIYAYIKFLVDRIDILENELENKNNELRLFEKDICSIMDQDEYCRICAIRTSGDTFTEEVPCCNCEDKPYFFWRGPQDEVDDI